MFLSVNGEIYNYLSIKEQLIAENPEFENEFVSDSDCEPVMYLYKKYGLGFYDFIIAECTSTWGKIV